MKGSLAQLRSEHGVHANVLREWKVIALKGLSSLYERRDTLAEQATAHEKQLEDLYAAIGRLTTQLNWLKKAASLSLPQRQALKVTRNTYYATFAEFQAAIQRLLANLTTYTEELATLMTEKFHLFGTTE
jgi:transposase